MVANLDVNNLKSEWEQQTNRDRYVWKKTKARQHMSTTWKPKWQKTSSTNSGNWYRSGAHLEYEGVAVARSGAHPWVRTGGHYEWAARIWHLGWCLASALLGLDSMFKQTCSRFWFGAFLAHGAQETNTNHLIIWRLGIFRPGCPNDPSRREMAEPINFV